MKFAFVENRYKTIFWSAIAQELKLRGHDTTWLVQNPVFASADDSVYEVPFPLPADLAVSADNISEALHWVSSGDRSINYFGGNVRHYRYYEHAIKLWVDCEKPDVVIGESTLFHELIVINVCRARGIPYFHPSMPGYPGGRYSVYSYASKEPLGRCKEIPSNEDCLLIAEAIRKREKVPDYLTPPSSTDPKRTYPLPGSFLDRLRILRGYLQGERFNTPAPWRKWHLDWQVRRRLAIWQQIVTAEAALNGRRYVLYPLQMQPEANLDVWGQQYRDQAKLVRDIADQLPEEWHLLVKANPKSKYELNSNLISVLQQHPRVSPIGLAEPMAKVLERVDLVCTVTGTVAVECVLSWKPVVQLGPGIAEDCTGCMQIGEIAQIVDVIRLIETGQFGIASDAERIQLIKRLYNTTFPGQISDPASLPMVMAEENVQAVAGTLLEIAEQCV